MEAEAEIELNDSLLIDSVIGKIYFSIFVN